MRHSAKLVILLVVLLHWPVTVAADQITVEVNGMVCSFCAQGIKKTFEALPSVEAVEPSLENKTVLIRTKTDSELADDKIRELMNDAGYDVKKIERR